jgi:sugar lactone lactonase YvrE
MLLSIRTLFLRVAATLQPTAALRRRSLAPILASGLMALGQLSVQPSLHAQSVTFAGVQIGSGYRSPYGVAVDAFGNVYVSDSASKQVTEVVAVNGVISNSSTIVTLGSGFSNPTGLALDVNGNLFVADEGAKAIKVIAAVDGSIPAENQTVLTLATLDTAPIALAVDAQDNLYFTTADGYISEIVAATTAPVAKGLATTNDTPSGLALDSSGNLYVSLNKSGDVYELTGLNGGTLQEMSVASGFAGPYGLAVDATENLYVSENGSTDVKKVLAVNGSIPSNPTIVTLDSAYSGPAGLALDGSGNLFIADSQNSRIAELPARPVNFSSANVCATGQTSPAPCNTTLTLAYEITTGTTVGKINILTGGTSNLDFKSAGPSLTKPCIVVTYPGTEQCTVDVTFTPLAPGQRIGAVQILDGNNNVLAATNIFGTGVGPAAAFNTPSSLVTLGSLDAFGTAVDGNGNLFFASPNNGAVYRVQAGSGTANYPNSPQSIGSGFSDPFGIALDGAGNVFVSDTRNNAVKEITASSGYTTVVTVATGFNSPSGLAVDGSGNIFVADGGNNAVKEIQAVNGSIPASPNVVTLAPAFTENNGFNVPFSVAVDGAGDVFVGDFGDTNLYEIQAAYGSIPANPNIITLSNSTAGPTGLAVDAAGDLYVAFTFGPFIQEFLAVNGTIPASPTVLTLYSQSNGRDFQPSTLALDSTGDIFLTDGGNIVVDEIVRSVGPAIGFAPTVVGSISSDSPESLQLQNIGSATLTGTGPVLSDTTDFSLVPGSGTPADCSGGFSLTPGTECNLSFDFNPQSPTSLSATATLTDNSLNITNGPQNTQAITLSGIGLPNTPPKVQISPTTINFGSVPYPGGATTQNVTITNIGGRTLTGINATSNGSSVRIYNSTCGNGVISGTSCTLTLLFAPLYSNGTHTNTITVTTANGGNGTVKTTGYAGAVVPSTTSLNFGSVSRGGTATLPITFTNEGISGAVTVAYATGSTSFKVTSNGCAAGITPGNSCTVEIEFAPVSQGAKTATIRFTPSSGPTYDISLTGTLNP